MIAKERIRRWIADARSGVREIPQTRTSKLIRFGYLVAVKFRRDTCFQRASALGFATLISLIPLTVLFLSVSGSFGGGDKIIAWVKGTGLKYVAPEFQQQAIELLDQNFSKSAFASGPTGLVNVFAIVALMVAAFGMMATAERYMNVIWEAPLKRGYIQRIMTFWVVLTVSPLFLALSLFVSESVLKKDGWIYDLQARLPFLGVAVDVLTPLLISFLGFTALYLALPATRVRTISAAVGGIAATTLWEIARRSFFLYVARQGTVSGFYGKLATIPLFLVWVYVVWLIVLIGAVIGFVHQHLPQLVQRIRRGEGTRISKASAAVAILRRLAECQRAGRLPPDLYELASEADIPDDVADETAKLLVARGLVVEDAASPGRFIAAVAADAVDLGAVVGSMLAAEFPAEFAEDGAPTSAMSDAWRAAAGAFSKKNP